MGWGTERLSNLFKGTQPVKSELGFEFQLGCTRDHSVPDVLLFSLDHLYNSWHKIGAQ